MCDQTEVSYLPGDVVWVKLGPVWWPGKVCGNEEVPPEVFKEFRKTPIAIVKFFQEDSFEYVKKLSNIYHYNCLKKNDFIKKGLDLCRSNNRDAPSNMKLFPEDIATAEVLTGGNPNIIHDEMFLPEKRPSYAADFAPTPKKTPKKIKSERKKETPQSKSVTPRVITHPRFIRHGICDYEARERRQIPLRAECDEEDNSPPITYRCHDCSFSTIRLNVLILHNKAHLRNYANQHTSSKSVKRKSTVVRFKERKIENEEPKVPKNADKSKPKVTKKSPVKRTAQKEPNMGNDKPIKKKRPQGNTDEFQNSLLEDWAEFENDAENDLQSNEDSNSLSGDTSFASSSKTNEKCRKSCFDFDDSEDGLVIDKSKIRLGRKIPRVLDDSKLDRTDSDEPSEAPEEDSIADDNKNGIDTIDDAFAETHKTSQLQQMGVDNEIEIDSEETDGKDDAGTTVSSSFKEKTDEQEKAEREAEELKQKVNKLLEEATAPSKLPDIPFSIKKAHIKSFNESEELARREAEKNIASEPETETVQDNETSQESVSVEEQVNEVEHKEDPVDTPSVSQEPEPEKSEEISPTCEIKSPEIVEQPPTPELKSPVTVEEPKTPIKVVVSVTNPSQNIVLPLSTTNSTTPVKTLQCSQVKLSTTPTFKLINPGPIIKVGGNVKSTAQIAKVLATGGDKNQIIIAGQSPQKFVINKSKSIILDRDSAAKLLNCQIPSPTTPRTVGQKLRFFTPNILQKTARTQVNKSPAKSIVLPSNIQGSSVVLLQPQKQIVLSGITTETTPTTPQQSETEYVSNQVAANSTVFTVQQNNIFIDSSGNVLNLPPSVPVTKEDILAKALENTDVLQSEVILTDATQSVLDTINVTQNTPITCKVYETNLTLNTPPIMSAYETPSRAVNSVIPENDSNEMIIISESSENNEYA